MQTPVGGRRGSAIMYVLGFGCFCASTNNSGHYVYGRLSGQSVCLLIAVSCDMISQYLVEGFE